MPMQLKSRRSQALATRFVGRLYEQNLFRDALAADEVPFQILYVSGPGGVGKTSLLYQFANLCERHNVPSYQLDARNIDPAPASFLSALQTAIGDPSENPLARLAELPRHPTILIDTYEMFKPIDRWIREYLWTQLPENVLVVLAGRNPPAPEWITDPAWEIFFRTIPLRNLEPQQSRAYLDKRGVPKDQHPAVLRFTHGHPLALTLVADVFAQRPNFRFEPEAAPDVIRAMLERFVQKVPGPAHRAALETCALVRHTTESLLAEMLKTEDVHEIFKWLRDVSFVESGRLGLFPHDVAREALAADLRWRNPDWYAELHRRARNYYSAHLFQTHGAEQEGILIDYIFLHRDNFIVRPFFDLLTGQESSGLLTDTAQERDIPILLDIVTQHEGKESARAAAHWFEHQPERMLVFRDSQGTAAGFLAMLALDQAHPEDLETDPGTKAAWEYLRKRAPLRPGEVATLFRFWMVRDTYQSVSPTQTAIFVNMVRHYLTTPGLAFTFLPCAEPDFWTPVFGYADLVRLPEADFRVGGRRYGVYGHDWRAVPPTAWLALLAEREIALFPDAVKPPSPKETLVVLSEPDFASTVRDALNHFNQTDKLIDNPLLRSRLIASLSKNTETIAERVPVLQNLVRQTAESLQSSPRQAKLYRALLHTFITPAPTQERAAEIADVPFSTYRRHLKAGIAYVVKVLWHQELGK